ncbi:MAG: hypothetical protein MPN21_09565 [Thermoanaerobaculia bacterium]|nr:hypothetical protein [Thermoanaerobaculia bacterium]
MEPNPLVEAFDAVLADREVDPIALADTPRRVESLPAAEEIEVALRELLEPADAYRLVWTIPTVEEP